MNHILSSEQFTNDELLDIFERADTFRLRDEGGLEYRRELASMYVGARVCSLFYEPSTRTRLSFETAAVAMGMGLVSTENAGEFSSAAKGETLEDTIRVLDELAFNAIILRHPADGSAAEAASVSSTPIINGGDGKGEHPTQALLDVYTIQNNLERLGNLRIVMGGDLKHGRTVRSLAKMLAKYPNNKITFVSLPELQIGQDIKDLLEEHRVEYTETGEMYDALRDADVVYWTRTQKERHSQSGDTGAPNPKEEFIIDSTALEVLPQKAIIMHPLPRVGEIPTDVDSDPRAIYFRQAGNGLYVRMALLDMIMSE